MLRRHEWGLSDSRTGVLRVQLDALRPQEPHDVQLPVRGGEVHAVQALGVLRRRVGPHLHQLLNLQPGVFTKRVNDPGNQDAGGATSCMLQLLTLALTPAYAVTVAAKFLLFTAKATATCWQL